MKEQEIREAGKLLRKVNSENFSGVRNAGTGFVITK